MDSQASSFSLVGMRARQQLAALNHNYNVGRDQATTKDGSLRWRIVYPKAKHQWVAKKIYAKTSTTFFHGLMQDVLAVKMTMSLLPVVQPECIANYPGVPDDIPKNIASQPPPDKDELIAAQISRFL